MKLFLVYCRGSEGVDGIQVIQAEDEKQVKQLLEKLYTNEYERFYATITRKNNLANFVQTMVRDSTIIEIINLAYQPEILLTIDL